MTYTLQQLIQKDQELGRAIFDKVNRDKFGVCCGNCRYFNTDAALDNHTGSCFRNAPSVHSEEEGRVLFHPEADTTSWCGEFERDTTPPENHA